MNHNRNAPAALEFELDGNPEDHSAQLVVRLVGHLKSLVIRAMEDKAGATERGRTLRRTGAIRIYIGTTGRVLSFGPPGNEEDEMRQLQAWRGVTAECLDTLSLAVSFGYFLADIEEVYTLPEAEQYAAKAALVKAVQKQGGLSWDRKKLSLKTVGKVFKDWKENCLLFQGWCLEVQQAEESAKAQPTATIEQVAMELATGLGAEIGDPKPSTAELRVQTERAQKAAEEAKDRLAAVQAEMAAHQSDRLAAVGTPNLVPETAPAVPEAAAKILAGLSADEIAAFVAAAQQMQQSKSGNAQA